jgi:glycosyltransferase involved in cell wall biosynthesis
LRIAVWHNLGSGGAKRTLYYHIKGLKEYGFYLEAWTTDMSSPDYMPLSDLIKENKKKIKNEYEIIFKIKNPITRERRIIKLLNKHCIECVKEIESKKFDLIFANSCTVTYMPYIGEFTELPKILYLGEPYRILHEAMPENIWQAPYSEFKLRKIKRIIYDLWVNYSRRIKVRKEIDAAKSYNKILVNSLFSRESVIRAYGTEATVCYLGIDTENFRPAGSGKEPYVIGLGSLSYNKNVHRAIEIIGEIDKDIRPVLKWVANMTDKWYLDELLILAWKLEVDFQFFVNIPDEELVSLVSHAAIMIYTSRLEPFGLAPLEGNACGTYVVAIAEGGIRESIKNGINGTLIDGYKIKEFTDTIERFIKNLDYAKTMGDNARVFVQENWNYQFMANNIISEVESVLNARLGSSNTPAGR